jgi:hypothetical protein
MIPNGWVEKWFEFQVVLSETFVDCTGFSIAGDTYIRRAYDEGIRAGDIEWVERVDAPAL